MCGLVGVMGYIGKEERSVLHDLLIVDTLRGKHSTGLAIVNSKAEVSVVKKAVNAIDFLDMKSVNTALLGSVNCVMGHNRYATKGAINSVNAHPFEFDKVVGAHNGTLSSYPLLDNRLAFDVDSECLFNHINDNGIDDAFNKAHGAMALTWFDKETGKLNFFRNKERPLCYTFSKDLGTLFWASEGWMLTSILWRQGIDHTDIVYINEDTLYSFVVPEGFVTIKDKLQAPHVRKLTKVIEKKIQHSGGGNQITTTAGKTTSNLSWHAYTEYQDKTVNIIFDQAMKDSFNQRYLSCFLEDNPDITVRVYTSPGSAASVLLYSTEEVFSCYIKSFRMVNGDHYLIPDIRTLIVADEEEESLTVDGYLSERLTFTSFTEATQGGCAWCSGNAEFGKKTIFTDLRTFFCHGCVDVPEVQEFIMEI